MNSFKVGYFLDLSFSPWHHPYRYFSFANCLFFGFIMRILPMAAVNLSFSFRTPSVTHLHGIRLRSQTQSLLFLLLSLFLIFISFVISFFFLERILVLQACLCFFLPFPSYFFQGYNFCWRNLWHELLRKDWNVKWWLSNSFICY